AGVEQQLRERREVFERQRGSPSRSEELDFGAVPGCIARMIVPPMVWLSFDSAFHCTSLRPRVSFGLLTVKYVALPDGANSSLRSGWPGSPATTEVRRAGWLNSITTLAGEAVSTEPLAGSVLLRVE